jgi:hypothetical protein
MIQMLEAIVRLAARLQPIKQKLIVTPWGVCGHQIRHRQHQDQWIPGSDQNE